MNWPVAGGGGRRSSAATAGQAGARESISPPQTFDPRVARFGDPDLEAVEAGPELAVRRDPDDEGVDQAGAAGAGRLLRHPADGLLGDPEPDLVAGGAELGPEPEGPVWFPGGVPRGQGPRPPGLTTRSWTLRMAGSATGRPPLTGSIRDEPAPPSSRGFTTSPVRHRPAFAAFPRPRLTLY